MSSLWPWLTAAGLGALHGLNPANGWILAAAWGVHRRNRGQALRALMPIALGHAASVALVPATVALGLSMDRGVLQGLALGLLVAVALVYLSRRRALRSPAGHAGIALWSFTMSTAHGAGLMSVHTAAMLAVTGAIAAGTCRVVEAGARLLRALPGPQRCLLR